MEVENMFIEGEDDHHTPLPGFRFHPTDEELVGFYLRRKVEKKPIGIELIKQADIYKYDPWDLPKWTNVGEKDKEWYFFCKRGRKYKNSVRPNRVTGSGFWKATGIDKPIYSELENCIGLKKSLVYYRGSAGKGSKTEWMMHEFRLPSSSINALEAEVWTLCRILRRTSPYKKSAQDWRLVDKKSSTAKSNVVLIDPSSSESSDIIHTGPPSSYISFNNRLYTNNNTDETKSSLYFSSKNEIGFSGQQYFPSFPNYNSNNEFNELLRNADWEDLRSVVDCAHATTTDFSTSMYL